MMMRQARCLSHFKTGTHRAPLQFRPWTSEPCAAAPKHFPAPMQEHAGGLRNRRAPMQKQAAALRNRACRKQMHAGRLRKRPPRQPKQAGTFRNRPCQIRIQAGELRKTGRRTRKQACELRNQGPAQRLQAGEFRNRRVFHRKTTNSRGFGRIPFTLPPPPPFRIPHSAFLPPPLLHNSKTPALQFSLTPALQHSIAPPLRRRITNRQSRVTFHAPTSAPFRTPHSEIRIQLPHYSITPTLHCSATPPPRTASQDAKISMCSYQDHAIASVYGVDFPDRFDDDRCDSIQGLAFNPSVCAGARWLSSKLSNSRAPKCSAVAT